MRSLAIIGALAVGMAAPLSAQGVTFRTGEIDPTRRIPTSVGQVLGQEQQSRTGKSSDRVPPGHLPPAGMCRIWIEGVPPGQQPAPTDCQTAVATKPANARVIWGDQSAFPGRANGKFSKGKSDKHKNKVKHDDRDDDDVFGIGRDDDDDDDRNRKSKSVAKRGRKG